MSCSLAFFPSFFMPTITLVCNSLCQEIRTLLTACSTHTVCLLLLRHHTIFLIQWKLWREEDHDEKNKSSCEGGQRLDSMAEKPWSALNLDTLRTGLCTVVGYMLMEATWKMEWSWQCTDNRYRTEHVSLCKCSEAGSKQLAFPSTTVYDLLKPCKSKTTTVWWIKLNIKPKLERYSSQATQQKHKRVPTEIDFPEAALLQLEHTRRRKPNLTWK